MKIGVVLGTAVGPAQHEGSDHRLDAPDRSQLGEHQRGPLGGLRRGQLRVAGPPDRAGRLPLFEGDECRTERASKAYIRLADGTQIAINEETTFVIRARTERGRG